jgi:hypothetical protein
MLMQPVDNIEAVLGRFQAWAGVRNAVEAKAGIRELSDEEALQTGRYRWKPARHNDASAPPESGPAIVEPVPDAKRGAAKKSAAKRGAEAKRRARGPAVSSAPTPKKVMKAAPEFRDALVKAIQPSEVLVAEPVERARPLAISVRLAPAERALIRTRAAEAGVSASAYIRQCALEVEQLRAQVREAIAAMEHGSVVPVQVSARGPGFLATVARRFFQRKPALALRA